MVLEQLFKAFTALLVGFVIGGAWMRVVLICLEIRDWRKKHGMS